MTQFYVSLLQTAVTQSKPVYSRITAAVLEDSGWYVPTYDVTQPLLWGQGRGCAFPLASCAPGKDVRRRTSCQDRTLQSFGPPTISSDFVLDEAYFSLLLNNLPESEFMIGVPLREQFLQILFASLAMRTATSAPSAWQCEKVDTGLPSTTCFLSSSFYFFLSELFSLLPNRPCVTLTPRFLTKHFRASHLQCQERAVSRTRKTNQRS